jgi:hypothetical protein
LTQRLRWTFWMKKRSIFSQISKSAITPSFRGRTSLDVAGRAAHHALGLETHRDGAPVRAR